MVPVRLFDHGIDFPLPVFLDQPDLAGAHTRGSLVATHPDTSDIAANAQDLGRGRSAIAEAAELLPEAGGEIAVADRLEIPLVDRPGERLDGALHPGLGVLGSAPGGGENRNRAHDECHRCSPDRDAAA